LAKVVLYAWIEVSRIGFIHPSILEIDQLTPLSL
jgi:hypothetical protein